MKPIKMHHIGVVVPSEERATEIMTMLGLEVEHKSYRPEYHSMNIFTKPLCGDTPIEFIVATEGILAKFNNGKGGIHHIAFAVDDVEAVSDELRAQGRKMLEEHATCGSTGLLANFLRPSFGYGILFEFVHE